LGARCERTQSLIGKGKPHSRIRGGKQEGINKGGAVSAFLGQGKCLGKGYKHYREKNKFIGVEVLPWQED